MDLISAIIYPTIKIVETDYEKTYGQKVKIEVDTCSDDSYNTMSGRIYIGIRSLMRQSEPKELAFIYKNIYSLIQHEIGHSRYTPAKLVNLLTKYETEYDKYEIKNILNALEDARMEHLVRSVNIKVDFKSIRYYYQDRMFKNVPENVILADALNITLVLFRTVYNKKYIQMCENRFGKVATQKLLSLGMRYIKTTATTAELLFPIFMDYAEYLLKLLAGQQQNQQQNKQKGNGSGQSEDQDNEDTDNQDQNQDSEPQDSQDNEDSEGEPKEPTKSGKGGKGKGGKGVSDNKDSQETNGSATSTPSQDSESDEEKEFAKQLAEDLADALNKVREIEDRNLYEVPDDPINSSGAYQPINKINIHLDRIGWQGQNHKMTAGNKQSYMSTPRDLNKIRYRAYKTFKQPTKLYDRKSANDNSRMTAIPKLSFFTDFSGSMDSIYQLSMDFIIQFYQKMNRYIDIDTFIFSSETYRITPKHLNRDSVRQLFHKYSSGTYLDYPNHYKTDLNVILTDGSIAGLNDLLHKIDLNKTVFIILVFENWNGKDSLSDYYKDVPNRNIIWVENKSDIKNAYEKAVQRIAEKLRA